MPQTLEDFTTGSYLKAQPQGPTPDVNFQPMPAGSKLGHWRRTTILFTAVGIPYNQPGLLDIVAKPGGGILIVDTGFGSACGLHLTYGDVAPPGVAASPLNLNLSGSSGFRLEFAGASIPMTVEIVVFMGTPAGAWGKALQVGNTGSFSSDFKFPDFSGTSHPPPPFSDITSIDIQVVGGQYCDFGLTSFLALP